MFKYAVVFLIISLVAGAVGFTNISAVARTISFILFGLFLLLFLLLIGFAYLAGQAINASTLTPPIPG